jgi:hypothetical protein
MFKKRSGRHKLFYEQGGIDFCTDEDISLLDLRDVKPNEKKVVARIVETTVATSVGASVLSKAMGTSTKTFKYTVKFELTVRLERPLSVHVHLGEHAGREGLLSTKNRDAVNILSSLGESMLFWVVLDNGENVQLSGGNLTVTSPIDNLQAVDGSITREFTITNVPGSRLRPYQSSNGEYELELYNALKLPNEGARLARLSELVAFDGE